MGIDDIETTKNVKSFFESDFWHYIQLGGIHPTQLSSPQLDGITAHTNLNGIESSLINQMNKADRAQYLATTILIALFDCSDYEYERHKTIMHRLFIKHMTQDQVCMMLNFSQYQLRKQLTLGCIEFAERLNYWRIKRDATELPNLIVEKTNDI